ncbi:hypothetical protein CYMTET_34026 [Cymbomonas tetramitiformis]|uniref:Uncharacterized protein n=1 Tax=Cymbomonas tetramitiformis TaxID=36881 RepID=A0AAE0KQL3_9CHLO|nr:hypothetical protein CYMTET_34026 [Cymbomonas tetramitiformis]
MSEVEDLVAAVKMEGAVEELSWVYLLGEEVDEEIYDLAAQWGGRRGGSGSSCLHWCGGARGCSSDRLGKDSKLEMGGAKPAAEPQGGMETPTLPDRMD